MDRYSLKVDLCAKISQISVGEKQRVEILKALYRQVKILILDEPTAVLTPAETDGLLNIMRKLREQGCTIVFITHKLKEVLAVTDRVTIMRKGVVTGAGETSEMNVRRLSELIVGREVATEVPMKPFSPGEKVLELREVRTAPGPADAAARRLSFGAARRDRRRGGGRGQRPVRSCGGDRGHDPP